MADGGILLSGDAPPLTSSSPSMDDVDEEGEVCRICRFPGSTSNPLRYPCACRGSIKYVHEECLFQWLNVDNKTHCEVCRHAFSFSPIFAENTPVRIPFYEIVAWGAAKAPNFLLFFLRLSCVMLVWFVIVPFTTRWVWRLTLMTGNLPEDWAVLFYYNFTIVDSLVGLLCHVGMNLLAIIILSLVRYFRQPTNQRPRIVNAFAGEVEVEVVVIRFELEVQHGPVAEIFGIEVQHGPVAEIFGIEGSIYHFLKQVLWALGINAALTVSLVVVPIYLGRMILYYSTIAPSLHALVIGYIPIFGLCFIYLWRGHIKGFVGAILFFCGKCLAGSEPFMTGNASIGRTILYSWRKFLVAMTPVMAFLKIVVFLVVELLIFSFVLGCWLDACTVEIWGVSIKYRIEYIHDHPLRSCMYYFVLGSCYRFFISNFISHVEKVLQTSLPILFLDTKDRFPNSDQINTLTKELVGNNSLILLLSISFDGILMAILIFLPVKIAVRLVPSVFPLDLAQASLFFFPNIIHNVHEFVALFLVYIPFVANHLCDFNFGDTIRDLLHHWFSVVGWVVGLSNCSVTNSHGIVREETEISALGDEYSRNADHSRTSPISFEGEPLDTVLLQIILMLLLAWTTLLLLNMTMLIVPVSIGRAAFNAIPYPEDFNLIWHNDFYTISAGWYIMWKCIVTAIKVARCITNHDVVGPEIWKMCSTAVKCLTLFFVWVSVIPLFLGLLLDLATAPLVVAVDATQVLVWPLEWATGSLCFNIWLYMVRNEMTQESEMLQRLRLNLVLLEQHGISHFTWSSAIGETIFPIISVLLTGLCVPYIFAKGIFPLFGYTQFANSAVHRFTWLGFLLLYVVCSCVVKLPAWFARLHNIVKDDFYVVGRRVHDYDG